MIQKKQILFTCICVGWVSFSFAFDCGEIQLSLQNGDRNQMFRYRYNATQLRIDRPGEIIPSPPINLLDLEKGTLSILHPHNGTWEMGDETENQRSEVGDQGSDVRGSRSVAAPRMAPPADWPKMPAPPSGLPEGIGPSASKTTAPPFNPGTSMGMPAFPEMPAFPMPGAEREKSITLVPQNQTNELFGFTCRLYEAVIPRKGTVELWLCDNPGLPPFHLLAYRLQDRRDRPEWDKQLAQRLRNEKMFPFRMVLKNNEGGDILAEWNIVSIKTDLKEKDLTGVFDIPSEMHRLPTRDW